VDLRNWVVFEVGSVQGVNPIQTAKIYGPDSIARKFKSVKVVQTMKRIWRDQLDLVLW
jgi:hypothetical protein